MTTRRRPLSWPQVHTLTSELERYRRAEQAACEATRVDLGLFPAVEASAMTRRRDADLAYERLLEAIDALGPAGP